MIMFNVNTIRKRFPFLSNTKIIYFDNASTSLVPQTVIKAMDEYYEYKTSNLGRGVDKLSSSNSVLYENTRQQVSKFINSDIKEEIIFTRGTTESINIIANYFFNNKLKKNDEIILNIGEHHSNLIPWIRLAKKKDAKIKYVNLDKTGKIDLIDLKNKLNNKTKIVAFAHITNVMGAYNDPKIITELVKKNSKAFVVIDGAQAVVEKKINVKNYDCDFYVFSAHKMYGPTGIGVLYGKYENLKDLEPFSLGGGSISDMSKFEYVLKPIPYRFEAGTMMISEIFGFNKAIDFFETFNFEKANEYVFFLRKYFIRKLSRIFNIKIYNRDNIFSRIIIFSLEDLHSHDIASYLSEHNIMIRAGDHCAKLMQEFLNNASTIRVSLGIYNTYEEVDKFIEILNNRGDFLDVFF